MTGKACKNTKKNGENMQNPEQESHSWLKFTLLLLFIFLIGTLTIAGGGKDINLNFDNPNVLLILKIAQAISVVIIFILPAVLISIFWTKPKIHYLGITKMPAVLTLVLAASGILLANPLINWLGEINQHVHLPEALSGIEDWMKTSEENAEQLTKALTKGTSIGALLLNLFVVAFMAALSEEIFFRGLFQKVAIDCFKNKHVAIWFIAVIFSAFHMQFYGFLPRMFMGAFLGYLFLWSGSLWPGILAHFVNNGTFVFYTWLTQRGMAAPDMDKIGMMDGEWFYVVISAITVTASLILVYRTERKRNQINI
jgi:uncharacterized protein